MATDHDLNYILLRKSDRFRHMTRKQIMMTQNRMCIYSACPYRDPSNENQEKLTHISAEDLRAEMKYPPLTWPKKLFQIACFLIFLGPLRLLIAILDLIVCALVITTTRGIASLLGYNPDITRSFNYWFGKKGARLLAFCFGVTWIHVDGKIESDTRIVTSNHVSLLDPLIILCYKSLSCTAKKEFSTVPLVKDCIGVTDPIYIDRAKKCGAAEQIMEHAANPETYPVLIFPEGTRNDGEELSMLPFKEGSFKIATKTGCPIVPVSINNSAEIFENHVPALRKTHVVIEYGKPIYPSELSKEELKSIGAYCQNIIQETIIRNEKLV